MVVQVEPAYQKVIEQLLRLAQPHSTELVSTIDADGMFSGPVAIFRESESRLTLFYEWHAGKAMLTEWSFQKDGARICLGPDSFNSAVGKSPAILSLAVSPAKSDDCIWKILWFSPDEKRQFELYVEDKMESGRPRLGPEAILLFAKSLTETLPP